MKKNNKIIIFGTGLFYDRRKNLMSKEIKIVAFIDNDVSRQGTSLDGVVIHSPTKVEDLEYDVIVLASSKPGEMRRQLLQLNVPEEKIMYWEEYMAYQYHGKLNTYNVSPISVNQRKGLIIVPIINFAGGFLAVLYVAMILKKRGFNMTIASPSANEETIQEVNKQGINVWICPALPYIEENELEWIDEFDLVWANSLQTMLCVDRISKIKPIIWWLHEHSRQYEDIIEQYGKKIEDNSFQNARIYAVSNIAKQNFVRFFPKVNVDILSLGIPDFYFKKKVDKPKINIAVIGTLFKIKNQKSMVKAIDHLPMNDKEKIECWFIGKDGEKRYKEELVEMTKDSPYIKILGELNREMLQELFPQIDVVVCCSVEETFSITIAEGLMNKKICITSSNTGIADFVKDGINGFVYQEGCEDELTQKLSYVINNFKELDYIRENARISYNEYLSIDVFGEKINELINKEEELWM